MLLMLGTYQLITSRLVRHWTAIPRTDLSYARYVMASYGKRSLTALCLAILGRVIVFIGLMAALVWLATHSPPGWDNWTWFKKVSWVVPFVLLFVAASYAATSGHRAVAVLRNKYWRQ